MICSSPLLLLTIFLWLYQLLHFYRFYRFASYAASETMDTFSKVSHLLRPSLRRSPPLILPSSILFLRLDLDSPPMNQPTHLPPHPPYNNMSQYLLSTLATNLGPPESPYKDSSIPLSHRVYKHSLSSLVAFQASKLPPPPLSSFTSTIIVVS